MENSCPVEKGGAAEGGCCAPLLRRERTENGDRACRHVTGYLPVQEGRGELLHHLSGHVWSSLAPALALIESCDPVSELGHREP